MRRSKLGSAGWIAGLIVILIVSTVPTDVAAQASRTRPTGSGSSGGTASGSGSRGGSSAGQASGRATYGYGGHGGYYGGRYYGYGYGWGYGWGSPYYGYPYWGWGWGSYWGPSYYRVPVYYPARVGDSHSPAIVETAVKPKKADVFVDGVKMGQARDYSGSWDVLYLKPGARSVEFRKDGFQTLRYDVKLRRGGYYRFEEKMQKGEGLDPRSDDTTAVARFEPPDREPSRAYRDSASFEQDSLSAEIEPVDEPRRSTIRKGMLRFDITPADAAVYLDGEFLAEASELSRLHGALPVAEGPHRIEIVRPGFVSVRQSIDVSESPEPTRVVIELTREGGQGG